MSSNSAENLRKRPKISSSMGCWYNLHKNSTALVQTFPFWRPESWRRGWSRTPISSWRRRAQGAGKSKPPENIAWIRSCVMCMRSNRFDSFGCNREGKKARQVGSTRFERKSKNQKIGSRFFSAHSQRNRAFLRSNRNVWWEMDSLRQP